VITIRRRIVVIRYTLIATKMHAPTLLLLLLSVALASNLKLDRVHCVNFDVELAQAGVDIDFDLPAVQSEE
jgi:hypothetical protein